MKRLKDFNGSTRESVHEHSLGCDLEDGKTLVLAKNSNFSINLKSYFKCSSPNIFIIIFEINLLLLEIKLKILF